MTIDRKAIAGIDFSAVSTGRRLKPVHPGEVLLKDFIEPMELTRYKVAKNTGFRSAGSMRFARGTGR